MPAEDMEEPDLSAGSAAVIAALAHEVQLLREIKDGLEAQSGSQMMIDAVSGLIEERRGEWEQAESEPPSEP